MTENILLEWKIIYVDFSLLGLANVLFLVNNMYVLWKIQIFNILVENIYFMLVELCSCHIYNFFNITTVGKRD